MINTLLPSNISRVYILNFGFDETAVDSQYKKKFKQGFWTILN